MNTEKVRILIIEDEKPIADLLDMSLTSAGYSCDCLDNGTDAADAVEETRYDLILLDVMLPDGDGFSLMERLKQKREYPILFLTARGEEEDKFQGFGLGADDYMVKPFLPKELIFRILAILRRSYKTENPLPYVFFQNYSTF